MTLRGLCHAGLGFPNGPTDAWNLYLQGDRPLLMLESEYRWHADQALEGGRTVLFRAMPGTPASFGWHVAEYAERVMENVPAGATDLVFANEGDLNYERGDREDDWDAAAWPGRYRTWATFMTLVAHRLRGVWEWHGRLHWPAWAPDHGIRETLDVWRDAAAEFDVIDFHAYEDATTIEDEYRWFRATFPGKPLWLTEWNARGGQDVGEDRRVLETLARLCTEDPDLHCFYFIGRWFPPAEGWHSRFDVEGHEDRLALFLNPPDVAQPPPAPEPAPEPTPMPALNAYEHFTAEQIAAASECPESAVREHWPRIVAQLDACGINDRATQIATIGTVAIETASTFEPVREAFWLSDEWRRANLRYYPFFGRGYVQLTWASNYAAYSAAINELWGAGGAVDLIARPDDALDPDIAAAALALYFRDHGGAGACLIPEAARRGDWREVRRLVQGADAGLDRLEQIAAALGASQPAEEPEEPADILAAVLAAGRSRIGDPYVWDGETPGGYDCSGFVSWCYLQAGIELIPYTDTMHGQCDPIDEADAVAGDICFYRYVDPGQPGVRYPHMGFWLGGGRTLEARYPRGVYEYDVLNRPYELRRAPGVAMPAEPHQEEGGDDLRIAELEQQIADLNNLVGNAFHDEGVVPASIDNALANSSFVPRNTKAQITKKLTDLRQEISAIRSFLANNNPDRAA